MNTKMLLPLALTTALAATLSMSACAQKTDADTSAPAAMSADTAASDRMSSDSMSADRMPADTMGDAVTAGDIVDTASQSPDHSTLVAAVKAADLVGTLQGAGPFTVFAPTNAAFDKLPEGTVDTLLQPENKADLAGILTYHVVSGSVDAATLTDQIKDAGGKAELTTVNGGTLTAEVANGGVKLTDAKGNSAMVTTPDLMASNGVIHVIDAVLLP
ncbi:putative Sensory subunit of low CO2-induced protein complex [Lysobacter sp. A03]|nr:putative Sensory subunit of low CO2-induced protein complex [Lysobacter sp. A03]